jgi:diacylglycerol O-acyltransferase / wax synthase
MERLSPLDVSFLHIEDADRTAHMHVASIAIFEGPAPAQEEFSRTLSDRLHLVPRWRQRVQRVPFQLARPVWVDAVDFDIDYHLRRTALAAPGGELELQRLVGRICSQRLDRTKPLWEIWVVEGLADGRWAMINKAHHCMVDGVSGTELLALLLDITPETPRHGPVDWNPKPTSSRDVTLDAARSLATDTAEQLRAVRSALRAPARAVRDVADLLGGVRSLSGSVKVQSDSGLTGPVGSHRVVAWAAAPLADVKAVRIALGGTVNDVVLAAITNGFRELLLSRGESVEERTVRTLIPVSVRGTRSDGAAAGDGTFNNKVSMLFAALPVGIVDPAERLAFIRDQLAGLKKSNQAVAGEALTSMSALAPDALVSLAARAVARVQGPTAVETVTTNVPGPQLPLYSLGRRMQRVYAYVPIAAQMRFGVTIFSYDGEVTFGVTGDHDASPDVDVLARGISDGLADLVRIANRGRAQRSKPKAKARG